MRNGHTVHRFGSFELDAGRRRLLDGADRVWLPDRQMDVLLCLVAHAGTVVGKETLIEAAWRDTAVGDNSIVQAIRSLRKALRCRKGGKVDIETLIRKGYRLVAEVESAHPALPPIDIDAVLAPHAAFVSGRAAVESLHLERVEHACETLAEAVRAEHDNWSAHVGLSTACFLSYESTRMDVVPNFTRLQQAEHHARAGCRRNPMSGDALGAFALARHRSGDAPQALAAARKAITLEPNPFLHHVRLAMVSWGDERLVAAHRTLQRCPDLAAAHWLAATVFVARGSFDLALEELRAGCTLQDVQLRPGQSGDTASRFTAVGLHWLRGLVLAALGDVDAALAELERERTAVDPYHVYARESLANSWYATGALRLRQRRQEEAAAAFKEALTCVPGHAMATIGMALLKVGRPESESEPGVRGGSGKSHSPSVTREVDTAFGTAAAFVLHQKHDEAAHLSREALGRAAAGSAGWLLPVEPLLHVTAHPEAWAPALAMLRARAM